MLDKLLISLRIYLHKTVLFIIDTLGILYIQFFRLTNFHVFTNINLKEIITITIYSKYNTTIIINEYCLNFK